MPQRLTRGLCRWADPVGAFDGADITLLEHVPSGPYDGNPSVSLNNHLFFWAVERDAGKALFTTDGTEAGTALVADPQPETASAFPREIVALDDRLVFVADDGVHGKELWAV